LKAGQDTPKLTPVKRKATATAAGVAAKAISAEPTSWEAVASSTIGRAPTRSVNAPPGPVTSRATTAIRGISVPARSRGMPRTSLR
jgi:hypothetical protein